MKKLIAQLDLPDFEEAEHPDLSLTHDPSGWALTLYPSGIVTYENLDDDDHRPRFMTGVLRCKALQLWKALARGDTESLLKLPWLHDVV